jgi:peptidoglycan/LPS O-acetylase OafA/YrhL
MQDLLSNHLISDSPCPGTQRVYLPALDGLRFFAFLAVLLHHVAPPPKLTLLHAFSPWGWVGIELFFVISAFLFFTLFQVEYRQAGRIAVGEFFIRRLLRLYPLMVGAPIVFILAMYPQVDIRAAFSELAFIALFAVNITWLGSYYTNFIPFTNHLWTLSFEFQIYLLIPPIFLICAGLGTRRSLVLLAGISLAWPSGQSMRSCPRSTLSSIFRLF